jgi:hypothetical protein
MFSTVWTTPSSRKHWKTSYLNLMLRLPCREWMLLQSSIPKNGALPIDYGDVCINYDKAYFKENQLAVPASVSNSAGTFV